MCGVLGLRCEKDRADLGEVSSKLLRMLEYRGYDSTGAVIQNSKGQIFLRKDVGSPTVVTEKLEINKLQGKIFCGQVRWATFGTVIKENAQPHEVKCKTHIYGAHNGNITNCDQLKKWLTSEGHSVVSDNDGEMLIHMVEHFFAIELSKIPNSKEIKPRAEALKTAILNASKKIVGSFAAVIVDPVTETMASIKAGSSLYMGQGHDEKNGSFIFASSDLGAVLSQTKILLPMNENEFCIFNDHEYAFYNINSGERLNREPVRSKLKIEEAKLNEPFKYFMEQEIYNQVESSRRVINYYCGTTPFLSFIEKVNAQNPKLINYIRENITRLSTDVNWGHFTDQCNKFFASPEFNEVTKLIKNSDVDFNSKHFESAMGSFLDEVVVLDHYSSYTPSLKFIDSVFMSDEVKDVRSRASKFVDILVEANKKGNSIYCIACGTSFNAAKTAATFFNNIVEMNISPLLPGDFRAQCSNAVKDGDVVIGVSQSGETKDLIDIFNQIKESGKRTKHITIVNNTNSTLALEKCDLCIPLFCGAEIAVPATKSFVNQLIVFYILCLDVADRVHGHDKVKKYWDNLEIIPDLIARTIKTTRDNIEKVASDLYMTPSIHVLATGMQGIAREGALKVREVVLNHTEGYEGTEFKHGPNTILGVNTIFGFERIRVLVKKFGDACEKDLSEKAVFESLYANYPLIFITGPEERNVNLTISQINTHKIRGTNIYMIAEENQNLRDAVSKVPAMGGANNYKFGYITLPKTDNTLLTLFSSAVVLQLLALNMSIKKLTLLDRLEIADHGVHPDSPKNVSKSITVD